jgi:hypothetical protein
VCSTNDIRLRTLASSSPQPNFLSNSATMQFFKAVSLLAVFFMAMFGFVAATPVTDLKRDVLEARTVDVGAKVIAVLKQLQANITVPLSQIGTL